MKLIVIIALIGAVAAQRPRPASPGNYADIAIVKSANENNGDGSYSYSYETSDGSKAEQRGYLKPPTPDNEEGIQVAEGSFSFNAPEGEPFQLSYIADENGFQPTANHLPTSPPIPEEIKRALEIVFKNAGDQRSAASFQQPQFRPRPASFRPRF